MEKTVAKAYSILMKNLVKQTRKNQQAGIISFESNDELQTYLDKGMLNMALNLFVQRQLNKIQPAERQVMLP